MNAAKVFPVAIFMIIFLAACGAPVAPTPQPTIPVAPTNPPPTATPIPTETNTPLPTETATLVPTETPVGQIFRDDFSGFLQPGWTWENERPDRWSFTPDGWLEIIGEDPALIGHGTQSNLLCRDIPTGDFQATIHIFTIPTDNFQQTALYFYEDGNNYIAINRAFAFGNALFMEYKLTGGNTGTYNVKQFEPNDLFLRLVRKNDAITGYYAVEPNQWIKLGSVGDFTKNARICLGVSNADWQGINADLVGRFDYFDISQP
jgi:hypothetical protein